MTSLSPELSQRLTQSQLSPGTKDFRIIMEEIGVSLSSSPNQPHILRKEQALVVREMTKRFQGDEDSVRRKFLSALKFLCKKDQHYRMLLTPTQFKGSAESGVVIHQDSLFSIFLKVPHLQIDIIIVLLDTVTHIAIEETQDTSWLRMVLKPLRCLPFIKNGEALAKKLLDILEVSTFPAQLEILEAIPDILPDDQCDVAAKHLTRLLDENEELCGALVDCLTALDLEPDLKAQIHDIILARILSGVPMKVYLILMKFLLNNCKGSNLMPTLLKIRRSLDNMVGGSSKEKESDRTLIFHYLQSSAIIQKPVAEGWLNTISHIKLHSDHKPIDLIIMFMLHHTSEIKKKIIEAIFRKRVSLGLFKIGLLERAFEKYITQQLLKDYMGDMIEIGRYLLRSSKEGAVAKYATALFECVFNHVYTGAVYRGEILSGLISLTGNCAQGIGNTVLKLILSFIKTSHEKVRNHIALLMRLLEKLDTFEFKDVKLVFDILCSLLCGDKSEECMSGFRDQLFNTVRKQLSCHERTVKRRGVISAIVMAKHCATVDSSDLALGLPKELLELVSRAVEANLELQCLYFDQLASILASEQPFNKFFLYWLYQKTQEDFEGMFLTDSVPEGFSVQYQLNQPEEVDSAFAINIAGRAMCDRDDKIVLLPSFFRVLRLLHFRQHGDLSEIESLLGCGVLLPQEDAYDDSDQDLTRQMADCLFHCANWFREIMSAFVAQKCPLVQRRVVQRLDHLINVERKLFALLGLIPGHNLPLSYFDSSQNVTKQTVAKTEARASKNPRKRVKSVSLVNDESVNTQEVSADPKKTLTQPHSVQFRELDTDIVRLMKYPLNLEDGAEREEITLNILQVKFVLADFTRKLALLTQNKDLGLSHLNDVNPAHLIGDCVRVVRYLNVFLETVVRKLNEMLQEPPEHLHTDDANDVKTCFGAIMQIFTLIFQWPGFQHTDNLNLLWDILKSTKSAEESCSINRLIGDFSSKISGLADNCLHLSHAVSVVRILEALDTFTPSNKEVQKKIRATAQKLLNKRWHDYLGKLDQGQAANQHTDVLIKAYLRNQSSESVCAIIEGLVGDLDALEPKDGCLTKLPAIDKKNFHVLYLGLCNALLDAIKSEIDSLTNNEHLFLWLNVAGAMSNLRTIAKEAKSRNNLPCFLKKAIGILKIFLSHGIPIMEITIKNKPDEVLGIFRAIQGTTRFLHSLCCQSKHTQDASIVSYIPAFKQVIESIIYRVKAALVANDLQSAFWIGLLRNRNIDGEDILSQSSVMSSTDGEDPQVSDEQLPSDDEGDDAIINDVSDESEVYG